MNMATHYPRPFSNFQFTSISRWATGSSGEGEEVETRVECPPLLWGELLTCHELMYFPRSADADFPCTEFICWDRPGDMASSGTVLAPAGTPPADENGRAWQFGRLCLSSSFHHFLVSPPCIARSLQCHCPTGRPIRPSCVGGNSDF